MPRKPRSEPLPTHRCDGTWPDPAIPGNVIRCAERVQPRRPSKSGKHWCPSPRCQAAKQRFYNQQRAGAAQVGKEKNLEVLHLVADLVGGKPREDCPWCGHPNALPGWGHRKAKGSPEACLKLGNRGYGLPKGVLDVVHPERAPGASD